MGVTANRHWMITALLALFVAAFVLVPFAEAATCIIETEPAHAASSFDPPEEPDDGSSGEQGLCVHGHCHHGGVVLARRTPADVAKAYVVSLDLKPIDAPLASHSPSGLKRPPKG